ncbi:MAG TPA: aldo/keto reductase [Burkholderiaceae bacterium]|nr:aldo/keto reductase [Burkholderiaceae bacterium]
MIFPPCTDATRLGLGGAPLGNLFTAIDDAQAQLLVQTAWESGCRTFDTAPHYGNGLSEHRIGQALRAMPRPEFVLSTKVGRLLRPDANAARDQNSYVQVLPFTQRWDYSAGGVQRSIEDSLQRLGMATVDVAYIHDCDATVHGANYPQVLRQVLDEALPQLRHMQQQGLVGHIGLGVNDVQVCLDVLAQADLDCLMLAGRYTLVDHSALEDLLPLCARRGVRIALGGVFNSGILATGVNAAAGAPALFNYAAAPPAWVARVGAVEALCTKHAVPLRAAALQFPLAHPAVEIVMLGAQHVGHWHDACHHIRQPIPAAFWAELQALGLVPDTAAIPPAQPAPRL